eukprot:6059128-Pleurochrysis_carterae.AAC.1
MGLPLQNLTFELIKLDAPEPGERANGPDCIERGFASGETSVERASSSDLQHPKDLAAKLGYVVQSVQSFERLFVESVTDRLKMREGSFAHQSAAYHLPKGLREAATSTLHLVTEHSPKALTWSLSTTWRILEFMGKMHKSPPTSTVGTSQALLKPSKRHVRDVLATLSDASTGGVLGTDGEGLAEVVCEHAVRAVRRGRRIPLA